MRSTERYVNTVGASLAALPTTAEIDAQRFFSESVSAAPHPIILSTLAPIRSRPAAAVRSAGDRGMSGSASAAAPLPVFVPVRIAVLTGSTPNVRDEIVRAALLLGLVAITAPHPIIFSTSRGQPSRVSRCWTMSVESHGTSMQRAVPYRRPDRQEVRRDVL